MDVKEALATCVVEGNVVKITGPQLDRKVYEGVKKALEGIGGKWQGGKVSGFVFPTDPSDLMMEVQGGVKRNLKKEFQFFATPDKVADMLVSHAQLFNGCEVLEPSAGRGAIVKAIQRATHDLFMVDCFELMPQNTMLLQKVKGAVIIGNDFLEAVPKKLYDRIIANPPFSKNQDIDHVLHMYKFLKSGGILVSVMSMHWLHSENKKEKNFRMWLRSRDSTEGRIEKGEFKQSGTNIESMYVVIKKE